MVIYRNLQKTLLINVEIYRYEWMAVETKGSVMVTKQVDRERERDCVLHEIWAGAEEIIFTTEKFVNTQPRTEEIFELQV